VKVPLVARISAGVPLLAEQMIKDTFWLPRRLVGEGTLFMLKVAGDSMSGAGIADGDLVVVSKQPVAENGEIVAAAITTEGEGRSHGQNPAASQWSCVADAAKPRLRADPRR
jgi:repressor LexA